MTIECELLGVLPYRVAPDDEFQVTFDISAWLGTDVIDSITLTAVDEDEEVNTDCYDAVKSAYTDTVLKPFLKGGGTDGKKFIIKIAVVTLNVYKKAFYIEFRVKERTL